MCAKRCKKLQDDGLRTCGSYALNEFPESGLCDCCYWKTKAEIIEKQLKEETAMRPNAELTGRAPDKLTEEISSIEYALVADEIERLRRIEHVLDRYFELNRRYPGNNYWSQEFLKARS